MIKKVGLAILGLAALLLVMDGIYELFLAIAYDPGLPILIKIALTGIIIGIIILFLYVLADRIKDKRNE